MVLYDGSTDSPVIVTELAWITVLDSGCRVIYFTSSVLRATVELVWLISDLQHSKWATPVFAGWMLKAIPLNLCAGIGKLKERQRGILFIKSCSPEITTGISSLVSHTGRGATICTKKMWLLLCICAKESNAKEVAGREVGGWAEPHLLLREPSPIYLSWDLAPTCTSEATTSALKCSGHFGTKQEEDLMACPFPLCHLSY